MNVCLFVCLFFRYAFGHRTRQCSQTFQESSLRPGEGRRLLFFREILFLTQKLKKFRSDQSDCRIPYPTKVAL